MDVKFNISEHVYVKLTNLGIQIWLEKNNELMKAMPHYQLTEEAIMKRRLDNGYWRFQLYEVMNLFGEFLFAGNPNLPFETDIVIPIELSRLNKIEKFLHENGSKS